MIKTLLGGLDFGIEDGNFDHFPPLVVLPGGDDVSKEDLRPLPL